MNFCASIGDFDDMVRFCRMLSMNSKIPDFVQKKDGSWTSSTKEILEIILNTNFPNCVDPDSNPLIPSVMLADAQLGEENYEK